MPAITDIFPPAASGGGGVPLPTGGYMHGMTTSGVVSLNITSPAGKKIVFTHFRAISYYSSNNTVNLGERNATSVNLLHSVTSLLIDSVDCIGNCSNISDFMGEAQGGGNLQQSDASLDNPFTGIPISSFSCDLNLPTGDGARIAYTYYLTDE